MVAQVAEVEVDDETGEVRVTKLTTAHNTGAILNPLTHQGQIDGSVAMGFGYGLVENLAYDESGKVLAANLGEYKIPNIKDMPPLHTTILQSEFGSGPYNSMSIGETALIPTAAAIANAVGGCGGGADYFAADYRGKSSERAEGKSAGLMPPKSRPRAASAPRSGHLF